MQNHSFDTFDREYLKELIKEFPVTPPISLEKALKQLKDRSQQWNPFEFVELIHTEPAHFTLEEILPFLPKFLHQRMFNGILGNAGSYREDDDPLKGRVEFELPTKKINDKAECSNSRFSGVHPVEITTGIEKAIEKLAFDESDPVENAAKFYQQFVRIHPFYDGNGRIGRYIVEAYLYHFGLYVRWQDMKKNNRWIRQLNYCHRKMTQLYISTAYPFALKWWIHYFNKFVSELALAPEEKKIELIGRKSKVNP